MNASQAYSPTLAQSYNARHFGGASGQFILQKDVAAVLSLLPPPPAQVLDIPCGTGVYTSALRARNYQVIAADASWSMLRIAELPSGAAKLQANIMHLPLGPNSLDAVVILRLFSHFQPEAIEQSLKELRRIIKPGGHILFDSFRWTPRSWPLLRRFMTQDYIHTYSPAEIRGMIASADLQVKATTWRYLFSPIWQRKLPLPLLRGLTKIESALPQHWLLRTFWACTKE